MLIYLADLSHTGLLVASNVMPLAIGLIGANIRREISEARVELFKYPDDLDAALSREVPDVFGISNYSWNCELGNEYMARIKARWPHVVCIAGGPNYDKETAHAYFQKYPATDFYIFEEGELAAVQLLRVLVERGFATDGVQVPGCHYMEGGKPVQPANLPRLRSLDDLPSAYTCGLMDKFFDGVLIPMTHTTRGCPFSCTFCTEGNSNWNRVAKRSTLSDDLEYIAPRVGTIRDLYLSDANVGMFSEDKDKARAIRSVQDRFKWPEYIHCSSGKNHKERVLEFAEIVGGKMAVSASMQSTNKAVLTNIKRDNISVEQLVEVARAGSKIDANTHAEIILNLPGDTLEAHIQSLRDAVSSGVSYLRMYQLIMLPGTEMNSPETRAKYGIKTHWRVMPRCFGRYHFEGESFDCAEIEEIATSQETLNFQQYLDAREWALTIEICHNANVFRELFGLCAVAGRKWFDLLTRFHEKRRDHLRELYDQFRRETIEPLWETHEEALTFASTHIDQYLTEALGVNELFNAKAVAFFELQDKVHDALYGEAMRLMPEFGEYLEQAKSFSLQRKQRLLDPEPGRVERYDYDFAALLESDFAADPRGHRRPVTVGFFHDPDQRQYIDQLVRQYGTSNTGLGRILLRSHVKKLFRKVVINGMESERGFENQYRRSTNLGD
jgi:radical SAM superfamily enzyme YgiQ (UPF0313 family)